MPRIIIFAPIKQEHIDYFAKAMQEADPDGIVVVTADLSLEQATTVIEAMRSLEPDSQEG
jgi:tryptophan synthase alpha subunit